MHNVHVANQYNTGPSSQINLTGGGVPSQTQCVINPLDGQQQQHQNNTSSNINGILGNSTSSSVSKSSESSSPSPSCKAPSALRQWRKQQHHSATSIVSNNNSSSSSNNNSNGGGFVAAPSPQQQQQVAAAPTTSAPSPSVPRSPCQLMGTQHQQQQSVARVAPQMHYHQQQQHHHHLHHNSSSGSHQHQHHQPQPSIHHHQQQQQHHQQQLGAAAPPPVGYSSTYHHLHPSAPPHPQSHGPHSHHGGGPLPPPTRYAEILEVPQPQTAQSLQSGKSVGDGGVVRSASQKDVEMVLAAGAHHWSGWPPPPPQHHGVAAPGNEHHLGYMHQNHRAYGSNQGSGTAHPSRAPPTQVASFNPEANQYLSKLHKINPRVAQSIINDSFLDQSRLFNAHYPPMYSGGKSAASAYAPPHQYSPQNASYYAPKAQTSPTYKYNAHVVEQPARSISPLKHRPGPIGPLPYMDQSASYGQRKQSYQLEYSQHYQHRAMQMQQGNVSSRHYPSFYNAQHLGPGSLQSQMSQIHYDHMQYPRRHHGDGVDISESSKSMGGGGGGGSGSSLKAFLESWNDDEGVSGGKAPELYVYDSTDISNDVIEQYSHIQQVDKLPDNIRVFPPEQIAVQENAKSADNVVEIKDSPAESTESVIKENVAVLQKQPEEPKDYSKKPENEQPTTPVETKENNAEKTEETPTISTTPAPTEPTEAAEQSEDVVIVEKPVKDAEVAPTVTTTATTTTTTTNPDSVIVENISVAIEKQQVQQQEEVVAKVQEATENVVTEAGVESADPAPASAEIDLQIEKVQINNREAYRINQNNIVLQIGDDMCVEIDVNSEGEKVITVKTNQGSWQLSELSSAPQAPAADEPFETEEVTNTVVVDETDVVNIQDWVCEEVVAGPIVEVEETPTEEIIQENKIESSEKTQHVTSMQSRKKRRALALMKRKKHAKTNLMVAMVKKRKLKKLRGEPKMPHLKRQVTFSPTKPVDIIEELEIKKQQQIELLQQQLVHQQQQEQQVTQQQESERQPQQLHQQQEEVKKSSKSNEVKEKERKDDKKKSSSGKHVDKCKETSKDKKDERRRDSSEKNPSKSTKSEKSKDHKDDSAHKKPKKESKSHKDVKTQEKEKKINKVKEPIRIEDQKFKECKVVLHDKLKEVKKESSPKIIANTKEVKKEVVKEEENKETKTDPEPPAAVIAAAIPAVNATATTPVAVKAERAVEKPESKKIEPKKEVAKEPPALPPVADSCEEDITKIVEMEINKEMLKDAQRKLKETMNNVAAVTVAETKKEEKKQPQPPVLSPVVVPAVAPIELENKTSNVTSKTQAVPEKHKSNNNNNNVSTCNLNDVDDNKLTELPSVYLLRLDEIIKLNAVDMMIGRKLKEIEEIELKSLKMRNVCCKRKFDDMEPPDEPAAKTERHVKCGKVPKSLPFLTPSPEHPCLSKDEDANVTKRRRHSHEQYNSNNNNKHNNKANAPSVEISTLTNDLLDVNAIKSRAKTVKAAAPPAETIPLTLPHIPVRSKEDIRRCSENLRQLQETREIVRRFLNKECLSHAELLKVREIIKFKSLLTKGEDPRTELTASSPVSTPPTPPPPPPPAAQSFKLQLTLKKPQQQPVRQQFRKKRRFRNLYCDENEDEEDDEETGRAVAGTASAATPSTPAATGAALQTRDPRLLYGKRSVDGGDDQRKEVPTIIIKKNGSAYSSSVKP